MAVLKQAAIVPGPKIILAFATTTFPRPLVISSMSLESEGQLRRIPTLVSYCQRGQLSSARSAHSPVDLCVHCYSAVGTCRWYGHQGGIRLPMIYLPSLALSCLGEGIRYGLIKPVLECCSADTLLRLEQSSPVGTSVLYSLRCLITAAVFSRKYLGYSLPLPCCATIVPNTTTRPMGTPMLQDVSSTCRTTRTQRRTAS